MSHDTTAATPRPLAVILRGLGIDLRPAKRECPLECAAIVARHAHWRAMQVAQHKAEQERLVRAAIAAVRADGCYASRHQVQKRLASGVSLRSPRLMAIWRAEAQEPGRRFAKGS